MAREPMASDQRTPRPRHTSATRARSLEDAFVQAIGGGLGLGMLALASGDLDTGGRVPSIDELRRAGDAALA